ncbi:class I SAM-dependent methyltransferase [Haloarchaeobius sp. HME9146]|uniref:class I SAM-dependent methyltransferase n=1 Tax=Haloarchaeobius sp. HME9146 TaxID=2978732 RepID=UPI0021BF451D|nr:methyltransferase domain-containing protein [Haloarchaeobius sp. HME9146]MCT9095708.1 methyltransferase domain-containing protein [Haloarchaeobius sp. HME9146]
MTGGAAAAQAFYGRWARLYDWLARYTPGIGGLRDRAAAALDLERGDTVVEMGCGTGANLPYLRERVGPEGTVVGLDYTRGMLARAQRLVDANSWDNVHLVHGDATQTPFCGDIDAVLSTFVSGMLSDPAGEVEEWCDMVGPDGTVVLVDAALSERAIAKPINALFRALTVLSTPPTFKFRYEESMHDKLLERVTDARDALRSRARATHHEEHVLGIVRVTGGRV